MNTCTGCGAPIEERTRGCRICSNRHNKWGRAGDTRALRPPDPETCRMCGGPYLTRNQRCRSCAHRHDYWLRMGDPRGIHGPRKICKGCGGDINAYTDGCKICARRKRKRERRAAEAQETQGAIPTPAAPVELIYRPAPTSDPVPEDTLDSPRDIENLHNLQSWLSARRARLTKKH